MELHQPGTNSDGALLMAQFVIALGGPWWGKCGRAALAEAAFQFDEPGGGHYANRILLPHKGRNASSLPLSSGDCSWGKVARSGRGGIGCGRTPWCRRATV